MNENYLTTEEQIDPSTRQLLSALEKCPPGVAEALLRNATSDLSEDEMDLETARLMRHLPDELFTELMIAIQPDLPEGLRGLPASEFREAFRITTGN